MTNTTPASVRLAALIVVLTGAAARAHAAHDAAPTPAVLSAEPPAPRPVSLDASRALGAPKAAPSRPTEPPRAVSPAAVSTTGVVRTITSLAAVLGLIALVAFTVRKLARRTGGLLAAAGPGGRAPAGVLEVLGRYPLARTQTLILLKLDRRILLVAHTRSARGGSALSTLTEITDPDDVASLLIKTRDEDSSARAERFTAMLQSEEISADRLLASTQAAPLVRPAPERARVIESAAGDRAEIAPPPTSRPRGFAVGGPDTASSIQRRLAELRAMTQRRAG